jgi:hypothetical protein
VLSGYLIANPILDKIDRAIFFCVLRPPLLSDAAILFPLRHHPVRDPLGLVGAQMVQCRNVVPVVILPADGAELLHDVGIASFERRRWQLSRRSSHWH